jgi:hypothetical protein
MQTSGVDRKGTRLNQTYGKCREYRYRASEAIPGWPDRIERKLEEATRRLANLEAGQALIIQHIGDLASADARQQLAADGLNQRLERIERRLELA